MIKGVREMRKLIAFIAFLGLCGCTGGLMRSKALLGGYTSICIDRVVYLQFFSGATVAYNPDGTIKTCEE